MKLSVSVSVAMNNNLLCHPILAKAIKDNYFATIKRINCSIFYSLKKDTLSSPNFSSSIGMKDIKVTKTIQFHWRAYQCSRSSANFCWRWWRYQIKDESPGCSNFEMLITWFYNCSQIYFSSNHFWSERKNLCVYNASFQQHWLSHN